MKKFFTDKKIRYGAFSTVITLFFIAVLIIINLIIGEIDYKFDMTSAETYSISDKSEEVLDKLTGDITIYTLFETKNNDNIISRVQKVLDQYAKDPHIKIENKDLYLYPDFAKQYTTENKGVNVDSIIVTNGDKYRVIDRSEYVDSSGEMNVESCVTSAINYVGLEELPVVYVVTGHGEVDYTMYTSFVKQAELAGYEFKQLNLLENDIPDDCAVLMMTTGARDYSDDEVQKIKDYLTNDGRLLFAVSNIGKETHPKMLSIISGYGIELGEGYIMEGSSANYMMYPYVIIPLLSKHSINSNIQAGNYMVLANYGNALKRLDLKKQGLEIENLLSTTENSYIKAKDNNSPNYEQGDEKGPFTLAAAVTDATYTDTSHATKLVIVGCFSMLDPAIDEIVNGSNSSFMVNALNWLDDNEDSVYIAPKSLATGKIVIDDGAANKIKLLSWAIIPGVLFITGIVVWLRRRNG